MNYPSYLCIGGTEVLNEARTRAYLRNCLGDSSWQFFDDCDCPPLAAHVVVGGCALVLDGTAFTDAATPDKAALDITGDIELVARAASNRYTTGATQTLVAKRTVAENLSFQWSFTSGSLGGGPLSFSVRTGGSSFFNTAVGANPGWVDGQAYWWRVRRTAATGVTTMAFAPDQAVIPTTWTPLSMSGAQVSGNIDANNAPVSIGAERDGTNGRFDGRIFRVEIYDGINGTLVAPPDFSAQAPGTTSFVDAQGNVWTLNGNAEIACTLDAYGSPATDPAPWYSAADPASEKFFGFIPERVESSVPTARRVTDRLSEGATLGPEQLLSRSYSFRGWLVAADEEGMRWGMRWMQEVLRGRICAPGCEGDDGELLISCADPTYFRSLVGVGLIDGPRYDVAVPDNHESVAVPTQFQIASQSSYLFSDGASVVSGVVADESDACAFFTTDEWFAGASLDIELTTDLNAEDITITMAISLDGTCDNLAAACAVIEIPFLPAESRLKIDGRRRTVTFFDPTGRITRTGFNVTRWQGAFPWFDVEACAQMCICFDNAGPSPVTWRVTKFEKEL